MEGHLRPHLHRWGYNIAPPHPTYGVEQTEAGRMKTRAFLPVIGALIWQKGDAPSSPCPSGSGGVMAARSLSALALILLALLCLDL